MQPVEDYGLTSQEYDEYERSLEETDDGVNWLAIARDAYETSDDFFGSSLRKQIEKNIDLFNSRHPSGSKYHLDSYKFRSKIFRPKTRSSIRRHEAAAATAYFSSQDIVSCQADDENDEVAAFGALVGENLINQRMNEPKMKWFQTCLGAYQDAMVQGAVVSFQDWKYAEEDVEEENELQVYVDGKQIPQEKVVEKRVIEDRPLIDLVPIENFRFDPASDWRDVIESSPYLVHMLPMYRYEVEERMENTDPHTGEAKWKQVEISSGEKTGENDSTRQRRTDGREDSKDQNHNTKRFDIVWVHRNIVRYEGKDWLYYTLGTTALLSEPVLLKEVFPQERGVYVLGVCNIETHKTIPAGVTELTQGLQQEVNDIANQRLDNVKLVVNRRHYVKRNKGVDTNAMVRSVPGGVVLTDDIDAIKPEDVRDVTSSSYAEQDRLNNDFDELAGSFSGSSVASNRQMNETVGGMELMNADANSVTDYQLRIFSETWLKPVLQNVLTLEKAYESDPKRLSAAGNGIEPQIALEALKRDITLNLAVGFGATNPQKQVEKLTFGLNAVLGFMPHMAARIKGEDVIQEVFGALGYQDGKRFFEMEDDENPQVTQLKQLVAQLQQQLRGRMAEKQMESQTKLQIENVRQKGQIQRDQLKYQFEQQKEQLKSHLEYIDKQIKAEENEIKRGQLLLQRGELMMQLQAFEWNKDKEMLDIETAERDKMTQVLMNDDYGMAPGIEERPGRG